MALNVLVFNCGSSTLKLQLLDAGSDQSGGVRQRLAWGVVDGIGAECVLEFGAESGETLRVGRPVVDHGEAAHAALRWLDSLGLLATGALEAVGHRVVHGGERFVEPTLIDEEVLAAIEAVGHLAPLHNEPSLAAILAARKALGPAVPMVAVFDTAFHRTLPERAALYAIPAELAIKHRVRRYGFHGLAHQYLMERYAEMMSLPCTRCPSSPFSWVPAARRRPSRTDSPWTPLWASRLWRD